jgi:1,4-alpha-glucan branching enzyme
MSRHTSQRKTGGVAVSIKAPEAKEVYVAGTFNNWKPHDHRLKRSPEDGTWASRLDLPPGRYEYKFVVDGRWCSEPGCDPAYNGCPGCVPNQFGTMNLVLVVGPDPEPALASGQNL